MSRAASEPLVDQAGCQLYLLSPLDVQFERFAPGLEAALRAGGSAAFLLRPAPEVAQEASQEAHDGATALRQVCTDCAVAFLIRDALDLALAIGADGVHLSDPGGVRDARARLGPDRILGASCGSSRHAAMLAGEDGADYIAFGEPGRAPDARLFELIAWWNELFVLPCLAEGALDQAACASLARAGADFVGVGDAVWRHPDGPAAGVRSIRAAIAGA